MELEELPRESRNSGHKKIIPSVILRGTANIGGIFSTYHNHLTFPTFMAEFHDTTLYCGSDNDYALAEFYLRVYSKNTQHH